MKILGYIVEDKQGAQALYTSDHHAEYPRAGVLLNADHVTLFKTRSRAKRAIERTVKWYNSHTHPNGERWDYVKNFGRPRIKRIAV